jgi:hypothetical protein
MKRRFLILLQRSVEAVLVSALFLSEAQAATRSQLASVSPVQSGAPFSVSREPDLRSLDRIERFIDIAWAVAPDLGFRLSTLAKFENHLREAGQWALDHNLPLPSGFSISADMDAGLALGLKVGAELVFLVPETGDVEMALFTATDTQVGAKASLGTALGVNLVYNMDKIEDFDGRVLGVKSDIRMIEGIGVSFTVDVEEKDFAKMHETIRALARANEHVAAENFRELITERRLVAVGTGYEWGAGAEFSVAAGWRSLVTSTSLPFDVAVARRRLVEFKRDARRSLAKGIRRSKVM